MPPAGPAVPARGSGHSLRRCQCGRELVRRGNARPQGWQTARQRPHTCGHAAAGQPQVSAASAHTGEGARTSGVGGDVARPAPVPATPVGTPRPRNGAAGLRPGKERRGDSKLGGRSGEADAAPQKMKTPAPTTGSRGSPRRGRPHWAQVLLPDGVGRGCAQPQGGGGRSALGSFPGPRSMRVKQDRPSALWEHASAPQQTILRVHWAAWPGRGLGEPPPSWEEWGVEETTLPAQDPSCSPDTRSHPPAPVAT